MTIEWVIFFEKLYLFIFVFFDYDDDDDDDDHDHDDDDDESNLNLNFPNQKYALAYQMYSNFQLSYYNRTTLLPSISYGDFRDKYPIFVIDCSHSNDQLKFSINDIRLEVESSTNLPANCVCSCLILHDRITEYTPVSILVRKL